MSTDPIQRWEVKPTTGRHFDFLDGLRGVAILLVVVFHTFYINPKSGWLLHVFEGIVRAGFMGVPIFFVLSGFLISYPFFRKRSQLLDFWYSSGYARRRLGKIVPPFYLSLVIFSVFFFWRSHDVHYFQAALQWSIGLPNFIIAARDLRAAYWSLVVETHFYLLLPLLFLIFRGLNVARTTAWLFILLLAIPLVMRQLTWSDKLLTAQSQVLPMTRFPCQLDYFAWGILFAGLFCFSSRLHSRFRSLYLLGYVGISTFVATIILYNHLCYVDQIDVFPTRWSVEIFHTHPIGDKHGATAH